MTDPMQKHPSTAGFGRTPATHEEDQRLEVAIAMLLRIGVVIAAVLVAIGGVMALRHPESRVPSFRVFHAPGHEPGPAVSGEAATAAAAPHAAIYSIAAVFRHLRAGSGAGIIALGLLVLIATPIARVIFAIVGFARERDMLYTVISFVVLAILVFSLVHGR
jgi:uncharacterized membrane protein